LLARGTKNWQVAAKSLQETLAQVEPHPQAILHEDLVWVVILSQTTAWEKSLERNPEGLLQLRKISNNADNYVSQASSLRQFFIGAHLRGAYTITWRPSSVSVVVPSMLALLPYARGRGFDSRSRLHYYLT
jgi:hypothetical protein